MAIKATVAIRRAELVDVPTITEIYNEAIETTVATFDTEVKSVADREAWFRAHGERHPILVAAVDGRVVGWASLNEWSDRRSYDGTAEASFYVHSQFRHRGVGRKLLEAIVAEGRRVGLHTLLGRVAEGSVESMHLSESVGFIHIGTMKEVGRKFGRLLDVHMLQVMLE